VGAASDYCVAQCRRVPPPWIIDEAIESFCIQTPTEQALAHELRFN
jgi:hypothetical protein